MIGTGAGSTLALGALLGALSWGTARLLAGPTAEMLAKGGLFRKNFEGRPIPAGVGVIVPVASLLPLALSTAVPGFGRLGAVWIAVTFGMAMLGFLDDVAGDRTCGGFAGHFRALFTGRLTTGALKALFGGVLALYAGWALHRSLPVALLSGLGIGLAANGINLLDVRPGRALKGFAILLALAATGLTLFAPPGAGAVRHLALALAPAGAAAALWSGDAKGRFMLGDAGANALGAAAGLVLAADPWVWQAGVAALLLWVHGYSERKSVTDLIARVPILDRLDRLGRPK